MSWNVYVNGDLNTIYSAYNGVAMLFNNDNSVMKTTAATVALLALLWSAYKKIVDTKESPVVSFFLAMVLFLCVTSTDSVTLESTRTDQVMTVDNVPLLVAVTGSISTSLFHSVISEMKTAFTAITPYSTSFAEDGNGSLDPLRALLKTAQSNFRSPTICTPNGSNVDYCTYIRNYFSDCIARDIAVAGPKQETSLTRIMNALPSQVTTVMSVTYDQWLVDRPLTTTAAPAAVTCTAAKTEINNYLASQGFQDSIEKFASSQGITKEALADGASLITNSDVNAFDIMKSRFIQSQGADGVLAARDKEGLTSNLMVFQAQNQRLVDMAATEPLYKQLAPAMITSMEFFGLFISPLILILIVAGKFGTSLLTNYIMFILTLNVWPLSAVMVESFLRFAIASDMLNMTSGLVDKSAALSMNGLPDVAASLDTYLAVGSALIAAAPAMFFSIFRAGAAGMAASSGGRQMVPDAPVDSNYVAPTVATAANAGVSRMADTSATADLAHAGNQIVGSSNGPLAGTFNVGDTVSGTLSQAVTASSTKMHSTEAAFGQQVMSQLQTAIQYGEKYGSTDSVAAQKGHDAKAALNYIRDTAENTGVDVTEAAARVASTSSSDGWKADGSLGFMLGSKSPVGGSAGKPGDGEGDGSDYNSTGRTGVSVGGGYVWRDTKQVQDTNTVTSKSGVTNKSSVSAGGGESDTASIRRGLDIARGTDYSHTGNSSESAAKTRSLNERYTEQQSKVEQLSQQASQVRQMGLSGSDDVAEVAQRSNLNMNGLMGGLSSDTKDVLAQRGVLNSDGSLTSRTMNRMGEAALQAQTAGKQQLSTEQAGKVGAASGVLLPELEGMYHSGDAKQIAAANEIVAGMQAQGYNSQAMGQLAKVGESLSSALSGTEANKKWEQDGGKDFKQNMQGVKDGVESGQAATAGNFNQGYADAKGQVSADETRQHDVNRSNVQSVQSQWKPNDDAVGSANVMKSVVQSDAERKGLPSLGQKPLTSSEQTISSFPTAKSVANQTGHVINNAGQQTGEVKHDIGTQAWNTVEAQQRSKEHGEKAESAWASQHPDEKARVQVLEAKGETPASLLKRQSELQNKAHLGTATPAEMRELGSIDTDQRNMFDHRSDSPRNPATEAKQELNKVHQDGEQISDQLSKKLNQ